GRAGQVRRPGAALVGPGRTTEATACTEPGAPGLCRRPGTARRRERAGRGVWRRLVERGDGGRRSTGDRARPLARAPAGRTAARRSRLGGATGLVVGGGGGLLSEAMAAAGARVTALALSPELLRVARLHAKESGAQVDYRQQSVESLADEAPGNFDVVTCMEM